MDIPSHARNLLLLTALALLLVLPPTRSHAEAPLGGGPKPAITPTTAVGTLAGDFHVGDTGSASYRIPLDLPAGTHGMVPSLALAYDSAAGNGDLGVGWSLSGLSSVARCPSNLAIDGFITAIDYTDTDALCLDGERLIPITGAPWKAGSVYAKRRDDLSRVHLIASTQCIGSIAFEVRSADGDLHEYGCRPDAVDFSHRGVHRWALARSLDRFGNTIRYEYEYDDVDVWSPESELQGLARADHRLARIHYTGHVAAPVLAPDRTIELRWQKRPDVQRGWFAGSPTARLLRLREIVAYADGELVRSWPLTYENSDTTGRSRLAAVNECAADGVCKPATTFEWIEGELAMDGVPHEHWSADGAQFPYLDDLVLGEAQSIFQTTLDANGDGMSDLLGVVGLPDMPPPDGRGWELWRSQPDAIVGPEVCGSNPGDPPCPPGHYALDEIPRSEITPSAFHLVEGRTHSMFAIDYDGDGRDDGVAPGNHVMTWLGKPGYWAIDSLMILRGGQFESKVEIGDSSSPVFSYLAADFTGDGFGDVLWCQPNDVEELDLEIGSWRVLANQPGIGFDAAAAVDTGLRCSSYDKLLLLDHDGDGVASPLIVATWSDASESQIPSAKWEDYRALVFPPTLDSFGWVETGLPPDLAQRWRSISTNHLNLMGVDEDFPRYGSSLGIDRVIDVQGDGLPDIVRYQLLIGDEGEQVGGIVDQLFTNVEDEAGGLRLWINDGQRFRDAGWLTQADFAIERFEELASSSTIDWNGDGRFDLLMPNADTDLWEVWISVGDGTFEPTPLPGSPHWPSSGAAHPNSFATMDVDGDALHDPVFWEFGGWWNIYRHRGQQPDRIAAIVDGLGQRIEIEYQSITDYELPDLHTPAECAWPASCAERPAIIVERHRLDTGVADNTREFVHRYTGARTDRKERRALGFARHDVTEWGKDQFGMVEIGLRTTWFGTAHYDDDLATHPLAGTPTDVFEQVRDPDTGERHASLVSHSYDVIPTSTASFRVVESFSQTRTWANVEGCFGLFCELDEVKPIEPLTDQTHIVYTFDDYGFALHERTTVDLGDDGPDSIDVQRTVEHDEDAWLIGQVTHETSTHLFADDPVARTHAFEYDPITGALLIEIDEPDQPELRLTSAYVYDSLGNVTSASTTDALGETRTTTIGYDERGRFPLTITNALGHVTQMIWHEGLSLPHTTVDPNGIRQVLDVDGFGRTTGARVFVGEVARGDDVTIEYLWPDGDLGGMRMRASVLGQGERTLVYDRLARPVIERWRGPDGEERYQRTFYDLLGRVHQVSLPTFAGEFASGYDTWTWDIRGRPVMHTRADGAFERWFYDGLTIEFRDFADETTRTHYDGAGRTIETERAPNTVEHERLCFDYGAFSTLVQVRPDCVESDVHAIAAPGEAPPAIKRFGYDDLGRLVWSDDPSQGERLYEWNAFDELVETFDANERLIEYEYDALGRTTARIDDDGLTSWIWDTSKLGAVTRASTPSGITDVYQYDIFARPVAVTQTIADAPLTLRFDYDSLNRVAAIHYPQAANLPEFGIRNLYGKDGSLVGVRRLADDASIWQIDEVDAADRVVRESFTNGLTTTRKWDPANGDLLGIHTSGPAVLQELRYTWNDIGTLAQREDLRGNQREEFGYDPLHRLAVIHTQRGGKTHERQFAYDTLGNLVHATDVGDYEYDERGRLLIAGSTTHAWDPVGNVAHRVSPDGDQEFTWTSFDKLRRLLPADGGPSIYDYDAEQRRVLRHDFEAELETVSLLGFYERDRQTTPEGITETHRYHVQGRDREVAEFEITIDPANIVRQQARYLHDDHLGSIDVISGEQGEVVQRQSFDAWGKLRDPNDWTLPDEFVAPVIVNRGYTGHERRQDGGLLNMGGRLYDPRLGRMANADPYVVAPDFTIGWNRYAYVLDDPLSMTDPSGFAPAEAGSTADDDDVGETMGEGELGQGSVWSLKEGPDNTFKIHTTLPIVVTPAPEAGPSTDAGPSIDSRGGSEITSDQADDTARDIGLGVVDGVGNNSYIAGIGLLTYANPVAGGVAALGFWLTGGNPASAIRQTVGDLIGSDTLSADPSSGVYTATMITSEIVSGGVAGVARGTGAGLRAAATEAAASCAAGSCGRAAGGWLSRFLDIGRRASCFVAGTLVATPDGPRPIEDLTPGDWVWAAEFVDGELVIVPRRIVEVFERRAPELLVLTYVTQDGERGELELTPEHPLYAAQFERYVWAEDLELGSALVLEDGRLAWIEAVARVRGEVSVYNLEVEGSHNYFAGDPRAVGAILVHNANYPGAPKAGSGGGPGAGKRFPKSTKDAAELEAGGMCVFCGRSTTRARGGTQRNTDHAIPKSRNGNNTPENAQNTCRDCNLGKSTKTTKEFLEKLGLKGE